MDKHHEQPLRGFQVTDADAPLIKKLSKAHQAILALNGQTYGAIATALDIASPGTVRSRLNRARAALAAQRELQADALNQEGAARHA